MHEERGICRKEGKKRRRKERLGEGKGCGRVVLRKDGVTVRANGRWECKMMVLHKVRVRLRVKTVRTHIRIHTCTHTMAP